MATAVCCDLPYRCSGFSVLRAVGGVRLLFPCLCCGVAALSERGTVDLQETLGYAAYLRTHPPAPCLPRCLQQPCGVALVAAAMGVDGASRVGDRHYGISA